MPFSTDALTEGDGPKAIDYERDELLYPVDGIAEGVPLGKLPDGPLFGDGTPFKTVTGGIFEPGFADVIQQMWAAYLMERAGLLNGRQEDDAEQRRRASRRVELMRRLGLLSDEDEARLALGGDLNDPDPDADQGEG